MVNFSDRDKEFMRRALVCAGRSQGRSSPNPMVGAVIVKADRIVGEGYHRKAGEAHAELHALESAGDLANGATLYVNIEPCCHHGRTPPCTSAIIRSGISRVVVATVDPNPKVGGKGIEQLRSSGISVEVGLLKKSAERLNQFFFKHIRTGLPFVILKTAMSLDGKIATNSGDSKWISSSASREKVHEIRNSIDAVLVGVGTVLKDNPSLTTRLPKGDGKDPWRIVADSKARTPVNSKIFHQTTSAPTLIATTSQAPPDRISQLRSVGAKILMVEEKENRVDLRSLIEKLGEIDMISLLVEGGAELNASAIKSGIVDKVIFFIGAKLIGGKNSPNPIGGVGIENLSEAVLLRDLEFTSIGDNLMVEAYIQGKEYV